MFPLSKFQPPDAPFCSVESILHERTRHAALFIIECTYTYTCSIQRRGGHATSHRTQKICSPIQPRSRCRRQTLFAPQYIPMEDGERDAAQAIAAIIRACTMESSPPRPSRRQPCQPAGDETERSGGVVVGREGGRERGWMGAMNFIMQEPSQWEMLSRWHREAFARAQR